MLVDAIVDWALPKLKMIVAAAMVVVTEFLRQEFGIEFDSAAVTAAVQAVVVGFVTWLVPNIKKVVSV